MGQVGPGSERQAALTYVGLGRGHHGNLTVKDQMASDFAFHLSEWVLKCRRWLLGSISVAARQHIGPGGYAGVPPTSPNTCSIGHLSEPPFTSGWPHALLMYSDLI